MGRPVIAILASGEGTTAEAFIHASAKGEVEPVVGLIIANKKQAGIFDRVKRLNKQYGLNIKTAYIGGKTHPAVGNQVVKPGNQTLAEEAAIMDALQQLNPDLIVLMGYMKKIGPRLVKAYGWQSHYQDPVEGMMLNTHAGLLPDTKGLMGSQKEELVIAKGLPESGTTVHLVALDYDDGPTFAEHRHKVKPDDTVDSLHARDQALEKKTLPIDIEAFIKQRRAHLKKKGAK